MVHKHPLGRGCQSAPNLEQPGGGAHFAVDVGGEGPVGQAEEAPDSLDEDVEADKDVIQEVPQKAGGRM